MIRSNAHTHTTWCDGKNSPEEMIQAALKLDFVSLGFSVHGWTPYEPCGITLEREAAYREELRALREKYHGQIEIIIGAERDYGFDRDFSAHEYRIDSVHVINCGGEVHFVDWSLEKTRNAIHRHFGDDPYAYCRAYYDQVSRMCAESDALFIGHIDLLTKFNELEPLFDETDPRYLGPALDAAACAISRGLPLEMNTGAISRGYRVSPYPSMTILKFIREQGGEIIINSDAHSAQGLNTGFDRCVEMARACGFDHALRLRRFENGSIGLEEAGLH